MSVSLKQIFQEKLHNVYEERYKKELEVQTDAYRYYIRRAESPEMQKMMKMPKEPVFDGNVLLFPMEKMASEAGNWQEEYFAKAEYVLFASSAGYLSESAVQKTTEFFERHPKEDIFYANEDRVGTDGQRSHPWFKPQWSPDTLFAFFYFGNIFAVRAEALAKYRFRENSDALEVIYAMVLSLTREKPAALLDEILYHRECSDMESDAAWESECVGCTPFYDEIKLQESEERGWKIRMEHREGISHPAYVSSGRKVSILIPSKDHPEVLKRCVESIRTLTAYPDYEIIVVDNGSCEEAKKEYLQLGRKFSYSYLYSPMEFNFSAMCNLAAKNATGELYLFLNDDMEILQADWLEKLAGCAETERIGAAGAKLYYPGTTLIQHAGITNMYEGPVHKLMKKDDAEAYYYGRNRLRHNVIGVTAACLMVSADKFREVGGFCEELQVAYNDVDFCFALHQKGYDNLVCNDVVLYHHESLSRGNDLLDEKKKARLQRERDVLYGRNPGYYDFDPYYSRHLTGVSENYECGLPYENRNLMPVGGVTPVKKRLGTEEINETLIIRVDHAERLKFAMQGENACYLVDLHAHVRGLDSCDYTYQMYLQSGNRTFAVPAVRRYRPDVLSNIYDQKHVELSGFAAKIPVELLPAGNYEIWMEAKSVFSRQVLRNRATETLQADE